MKRRVAATSVLLLVLCSLDLRAQTAPGATNPATTTTSQPKDTDNAATSPKKPPEKPKPKKSPKRATSKPVPSAPTPLKAESPTQQPKQTGTAAKSESTQGTANSAIPSTPPSVSSAPAAPPTPSPQAAVAPPVESDPAGVARLISPTEDRVVIPLGQPDRMTVPVASVQVAAGAADPLAAPTPSPPPASTSKEKEELEALRQTTLNLIKLLVESGILTQEKADALMREAKQSAAQSTAAQTSGENKVVRVPYVPQFMRDEMKEELRQEVVAQAKAEGWAQPNAIPQWVDRFTFFGDLRLRYQMNQLSPDNAPAVDVNATNTGNGLVLLNTTNSFDYFRYQLRLGANMRVSDTVLAGASFASGNTGNPVSLNQTLGTGFNKNSVVIDLAFLRFDPARWLTIWGGRIPNPFYSTDLVWYDQLNFDGFAVTTRTPLGARSAGWLTLGAFPVQNIDCTDASALTCGDNKWLFGAQGVFQTALAERHKLTLSLAYYDWYRYQGQLNSPTVNPEDQTFVPRFAQKGNTYFNVVTSGGNPLLGVAAQFKELDLTGSLDLGYWDPVRAVLTGDVVKNVGYNQQQIYEQTGGLVNQAPRTLGWYLRLLVGKPILERWPDWQAWAGYKYVERDSVVDGYNDPDFHFGGTDAKGYLLGLSVGIAKNTFARFRWYSANSIDGPPLAWDVLQFDVGARF